MDVGSKRETSLRPPQTPVVHSTFGVKCQARLALDAAQ
jgi:hypothetical protein